MTRAATPQPRRAAARPWEGGARNRAGRRTAQRRGRQRPAGRCAGQQAAPWRRAQARQRAHDALHALPDLWRRGLPCGGGDRRLILGVLVHADSSASARLRRWFHRQNSDLAVATPPPPHHRCRSRMVCSPPAVSGRIFPADPGVTRTGPMQPGGVHRAAGTPPLCHKAGPTTLHEQHPHGSSLRSFSTPSRAGVVTPAQRGARPVRPVTTV